MKIDDLPLRDYFAGCALTGLIAGSYPSGLTDDELAEIAYLFADAMLRAREAKP